MSRMSTHRDILDYLLNIFSVHEQQMIRMLTVGENYSNVSFNFWQTTAMFDGSGKSEWQFGVRFVSSWM